jgi:hypothetical protein
MNRIASTALAAFAAAFAGTSLAGASNGTKLVPFHAEIDYATAPATTSAPCPTTMLRIDIAVTDGLVSHLGRITSRDYYACLNPVTLAFSGRYVYVAANGDTIDGGYAGRFVPTASPGVLAIDAHWFIDGGTGRFAGATGSGTASGSGTAGSGHFAQDGTISSVGSSG